MHGSNQFQVRGKPHSKNKSETKSLGLPVSLSISLDIPLVDPLLSPLTAGNTPQTSNNAQTQIPTSSPTPAPPPAPAPEQGSGQTPTPGTAPAPPSTPSPIPGDTPAITAPAQAPPSPQPTAGGLSTDGVQTSVGVGGESGTGGASQTSPQGSAPLSDGPPSSARFNVNPNDSNAPSSSPGAVPTSRPGTSKNPSASDRTAPTFAGKSSEPLAFGSASLIAAVNVQSAFDDPSSLSAADAQPTGSSGSHKGPNTPGSGSGTGGDGGSGGNDDPGSGSPGSSAHHGLSKGAIAAIAVIAALIALIILFFLLRRFSISKRVARRQRWFRSASKFSPSVGGDDHLPRNRTSNGSSFVTNIDHGQRPPSDLIDASWPPPEMVQNLPTPLQLPISVPPLAPTTNRPVSPVFRTSDNLKALERSASQLSQYLIVPVTTPIKDSSSAAAGLLSLPSPISVRPFSPSESWRFPRPPADDLQRQSQDILSATRSTTSVTTATKSNISRCSMTTSEEYMTAPDADTELQNPFTDLASVDTHDTHYTAFTDTTDASYSDHFDDIEVIRRPFTPNLGDELAVSPGDEVRVRKRFDDGWAYAEKVKGGVRGLFPIDCLRMEDQELPAFLAARRLSSYVTDPFSDYAF